MNLRSIAALGSGGRIPSLRQSDRDIPPTQPCCVLEAFATEQKKFNGVPTGIRFAGKRIALWAAVGRALRSASHARLFANAPFVAGLADPFRVDGSNQCGGSRKSAPAASALSGREKK